MTHGVDHFSNDILKRFVLLCLFFKSVSDWPIDKDGVEWLFPETTDCQSYGRYKIQWPSYRG